MPGSADGPAAPPPREVAPDADLVAARRTAAAALFALIALVVAVAVAIVLRDSGDEPSPAVDAASGAPAGVSTGDIGPRPGQPIDGYIAARQQALAAVGDGDERVAVVSFTRYRTAAEADAVLHDAGVDRNLTLAAWLVAAPGGDPTTVTGALTDWAAAARAHAEGDRAQIEQILPTVEKGSEFIPFYEHELVRLAAVRDGADPDGPVVFALVVRAKGSALRTLAARPEVRLVDVGPTADPPADVRYAGLLPDDVTTTGTPPQRPIPAR